MKAEGRARRLLKAALPSVYVALFVTVFALFSPQGRVLFSAGRFRVTQGALLAGLKKSAVLTASVALSKVLVSPRICLPGKPGAFARQVFFYYERLCTGKFELKRGSVIKTIDARLCEIFFG